MLYEYDCKKCGRLELEKKMTDPDIKDCPICGNKLKRIISVPLAFKFVGKGFYATDYGRTTATIDGSQKPSEGNVFFDEAFPRQGKIVEKLRKRRKDGLPLDGSCCKEAGMAMREAGVK